jgi:hypothetical protein
MNNQANTLAKESLLHTIFGGNILQGNFPFELVKIKVSGNWVSGSPHQALKTDWGYCAAQSLLSDKDIICKEDFHLVWWDGLGTTMATYPKMYRVWLTKHVLDFCGNNNQLYYWSKGTHSPKCEFCFVQNEFTTHIAQCWDPGQESMFCITVQEIKEWMVKTLWDIGVALMVKTYRLLRGNLSMEICCHGNNQDILLVVTTSNQLRWDSFVHGCISTHWIPIVTPLLAHTSPDLLAKMWGRCLIARLHNVIHK